MDRDVPRAVVVPSRLAMCATAMRTVLWALPHPLERPSLGVQPGNYLSSAPGAVADFLSRGRGRGRRSVDAEGTICDLPRTYWRCRARQGRSGICVRTKDRGVLENQLRQGAGTSATHRR